MNVYQWLTILGIPSIISGILTLIFNIGKKRRADIEALKLGVQALLRSELIENYNKWTERGYMPIYAKENFQNIYKQYHNLGANGVMDAMYLKVMALPERSKDEQN